MLRCPKPPFHHLDHPALNHVGRAEALDALAAQFDRALRDGAALAREQVADRAQRRRLAGAVAAHEGDDSPFGHPQRHALEDQDDVVVDDLDAVDIQKRGAAHGIQLWQSAGVRRCSFFSAA